MCSFKLICFIVFLFNIYAVHCLISDKRLCINEDCSEPISLAKTLLGYNRAEEYMLSFRPNINIKIYSKEAGSNPDLWGAEINGERGYIPKTYVRELKIFRKPTIVVETELSKKPSVPQNTPEKEVNPDKVKESFEVVDGTTILLDPIGISPSSTENPILSTVSNNINSQETTTESYSGEEKISDAVDNVETETLPPPSQDTEVKTEDSVVGGVLSSIKNWISDDDESPEDDEEDDGEDNEDEEGDNEEDLHIDSEEEVPGLDSEKSSNDYAEIKENVEDKQKPRKDANKPEPDIKEAVETSAELKKNENEASKDEIIQSEADKVIASKQRIEEEKSAELKNNEIDENGSSKNQILESETNPIIEDSTQMKGDIGKSSEMTVDIDKEEQKLKESLEVTTIDENVKIGNSQESVDASKVEQSNPADTINKPNIEPTNETNIEPADELEKISTESPQAVKIEKESTETLTELPIDATTLPSMDQYEALPVVLTETVMPDPVVQTQELKLQGNIYSPIVSSFFDKNTENKVVEKRGNTEHVPTNDASPAEVNSLELEVPKNNTLVADTSSAAVNKLPAVSEPKYEANGNLESLNLPESGTPVEQEQVKPGVGLWPEFNKPKVEAPVQGDAPLNGIPSPEIPPFLARSNEDTNKEIPADKITLGNPEISSKEDIAIPDAPSDAEINALKNSDGALPNNLLGDSLDEGVVVEEKILVESGGFFSGFFSLFGGSDETKHETVDTHSTPVSNADRLAHENTQYSSYNQENDGYCLSSQENCDTVVSSSMLEKLVFLTNSDILIYLGTTAVSCIIFLLIYLLVDKSSREAPLVQKINKLEKELLVIMKENDILQESAPSGSQVPSEEVDLLRQQLEQQEVLRQTLEMQVMSLQKETENKRELEEQIESLEKELESSTEVGMELNRMISEMLDSNNGGEKLKENVEQLQRQLLEQKSIINDISNSLSNKEEENAGLQAQLDDSKKQSSDLQQKLDEIVEKILRIERERDQQEKSLHEEISIYRQKCSEEMMKKEMFSNEIKMLQTQLTDAQRKAELKIKEYQSLKDSLKDIKSIKNDNVALQSLLDVTSIKAELEQLKSENERYTLLIKQEEEAKILYEKRCQAVIDDNNALLKKYQESDKEKVEATMKLEVLNNYFKKREEELQSEILKYKTIWDAKEGEATSTTERMRLISEEIENYKSQNETLKQEIVSQEIELKSQISMLEKKVHENWVASRQMERKLEDSRQETALLRNRLTLRERAMIDERTQNRLQSPVDQNGELTLSPPPMESPASPSMLFGGRDHITKSPPMPGLPPFLPPPPGAPFMPPHLSGMPFMPPPPSMFPGDHRPPPLGRMSSPPPLNSRYSPDTSAFSPYDRNSPSPPYDSEYGASPPPMRGYSPYSRDDRRDYKRPMHISNGRSNKGSIMSSGSDHSNDSLDKLNRKQSKMV